MADFLFVPQSALDRWSDQGKVVVDGQNLTIVSGSSQGRTFSLTPAVRFMKMEAGDDVVGLLTKVKTLAALQLMGAEQFAESVLLGDSAYLVQTGFLADGTIAQAAAGPAPKAKETELLAQFILDKSR